MFLLSIYLWIEPFHDYVLEIMKGLENQNTLILCCEAGERMMSTQHLRNMNDKTDHSKLEFITEKLLQRMEKYFRPIYFRISEKNINILGSIP